jgi:hypothetical protein
MYTLLPDNHYSGRAQPRSGVTRDPSAITGRLWPGGGASGETGPFPATKGTPCVTAASPSLL